MIVGLLVGVAIGLTAGMWLGAKHPDRVLRDDRYPSAPEAEK